MANRDDEWVLNESEWTAFRRAWVTLPEAYTSTGLVLRIGIARKPAQVCDKVAVLGQGVDLSNIVMEKLSEGAQQEVLLAIDQLGTLLKNKAEGSELVTAINKLKAECDKGLAQKFLAGKSGAYDLLIDILDKFRADKSIISPALAAITSLMTGFPDLLTMNGIDLMLQYFDNEKDPGIILQVLKWTKQCCIKHEKNREDIFDRGVMARLKDILHRSDKGGPLIQAVCGVVRCLVLDDDIRVEFGRSHEHAKQLAMEFLCDITTLLQKCKNDVETVSELLQTLASLIVKNELCQKADEAGAVTVVIHVLKQYPKNEKLVRQCMKLLKNLAGNDGVKDHLVKAGCAPLLVSCLSIHKASVNVAALGCACIAALTLRSPSNSKVLHNAGAPEVIVDLMKIHKDNSDVQKQASWAIRNIVSRDRSLCKTFLDAGAEELLREALVKHKKTCDYDIKSALRDLGCEVELKERWTGKGGRLNH